MVQAVSADRKPPIPEASIREGVEPMRNERVGKSIIIAVLTFMVLFLVHIARSDDGGFHGRAELGYVIGNDLFYTDLELGYLIGSLRNLYIDIYGGVTVMSEFERENWYEARFFVPFRDRYKVGVQTGWRFMYVKFEHYCTHAVWSNEEQFKQKFFGENCTTVSVGVQFE
jgi:hypothetical protein